MRVLSTRFALLAALSAVLVGGVPALAQQTSPPSSSPYPLIGAWIVDPTPQDTTDPNELLSVGPGGVLVDSSAEGVGVGTWSSTGDQAAALTFMVPEGTNGFLTIRAEINVAGDGQTFQGTYTIEFPAAMQQQAGMAAGQYGPGQVTGQRISVEPLGSPVGPIPQGPGPGESPAASGESPAASSAP